MTTGRRGWEAAVDTTSPDGDGTGCVEPGHPVVVAVVGATAPAFDDCYRDEWTALVALGWTLTGSWPVAEELVQDAFADAYRRWDEVGAMDRPGAWVRRAVVNRAVSLQRHRAVERRGLVRWRNRASVDSDVATSDRTGDDATGRVGDPAFWAAVRSLPDRQGAAIALHYLEDRSVDDIAEVLGCRPATVRVHLHRARQSLAERMGALTDSTHRQGQPAGTDEETSR